MDEPSTNFQMKVKHKVTETGSYISLPRAVFRRALNTFAESGIILVSIYTLSNVCNSDYQSFSQFLGSSRVG